MDITTAIPAVGHATRTAAGHVKELLELYTHADLFPTMNMGWRHTKPHRETPFRSHVPLLAISGRLLGCSRRMRMVQGCGWRGEGGHKGGVARAVVKAATGGWESGWYAMFCGHRAVGGG